MQFTIRKKEAALCLKVFGPELRKAKCCKEVYGWVCVHVKDGMVNMSWIGPDARWHITRRPRVDEEFGEDVAFLPIDVLKSGELTVTTSKEYVEVVHSLGKQQINKEEWEECCAFRDGYGSLDTIGFKGNECVTYNVPVNLQWVKEIMSHASHDPTRIGLTGFMLTEDGIACSDGRRLVIAKYHTGLPADIRFTTPIFSQLLGGSKRLGLMDLSYTIESNEHQKKREKHNKKLSICDDKRIAEPKDLLVLRVHYDDGVMIRYEFKGGVPIAPDIKQIIPVFETKHPVLTLAWDDIEKLKLIHKDVDQITFIDGQAVNAASNIGFPLSGKLHIPKITLNPHYIVDDMSAGLSGEYYSNTSNEDALSPVCSDMDDRFGMIMPMRVN